MPLHRTMCMHLEDVCDPDVAKSSLRSDKGQLFLKVYRCHVGMHVGMHVSMHVGMHVGMHVCMHTIQHACMQYVCMHVYILVCFYQWRSQDFSMGRG